MIYMIIRKDIMVTEFEIKKTTHVVVPISKESTLRLTALQW